MLRFSSWATGHDAKPSFVGGEADKGNAGERAFGPKPKCWIECLLIGRKSST
jgi:hypothetical protein